MRMANRLRELGSRLRIILVDGLAQDPLAHAEQVAKIAGVLHDAFEPEGFSATLVGGSAIEIHAPGIYLSGDLDYVIERRRPGTKQVDQIFKGLGFVIARGLRSATRHDDSGQRTSTRQGMKNSLPDLRDKWAERLERVRRSQARTDVRGMTRPPRDPVERAFLRRIGREGPFIEGSPPAKPPGPLPR